MAVPYGYGPGGQPGAPMPAPPTPPYGGAYPGPPTPGPPYPGGVFSVPANGPSAQALDRLPVQRPGVIAVSASMSITASLMWMVLLGFAILTAYSLRSSFNTSDQVEGFLYIVLDRFLIRMGQGLAIPLFGFPLAATVAGFLLLARKPWARIAFSGLGVLALGWSAWWLRLHLGWWVPVVVYIALAALLPWIPAVGRWYADRPDPDPGQRPGPVPGAPELPSTPQAGAPSVPYSAPYGQFRS